MAQTNANQAGHPVSKALRHPDTVTVFESPPEIMPTPLARTITVPANAFSCDPAQPRSRKHKDAEDEPYLILGFDTEFKTPEYLIDRDKIVTGQAKYRVLSYQFHAKTTDGREWQGICCPIADERMTIGAFIAFALGLGVEDHNFQNLPTKIYLVGHFTRADLPVFADFKDMTSYMSNVRNTFVSIDAATDIELDHQVGAPPTKLRVLIRDTLLLTPQASRSLKEIGKLVGHVKLELDPDPAKHKEMIRNMDRVRKDHWEIFRAYALNDATICVRYIERVIAQFYEETGSKKVPVTLTSIGIEILLNTWRDLMKINPLSVLGKEEVTERYFDKKNNRFVTKKAVVVLEQVAWHLDFVTECYHGGRNEQFWFGPAFEDTWTDFDLSSAYPTAMSLIGRPLWSEVREESDPTKYEATTLGFANVDFDFPAETRYPTLPVRTNHGLIFPLKGKSNCSSPEIAAALALGATIKINHGIIVPTDSNCKIFGEFIKYCLGKRREASDNKLQGLFWKEISNSTYGKTAQGLRAKRVFDMRDSQMKDLPQSKITNPFFAAYITSFTRAVLGEIINALPASVCVFSCTTDGFLTTASEDEIAAAQTGVLCNLFNSARLDLTGISGVLEKKHIVKMPLGWRTRGQATLIPGATADKDESFNVVLAKGGIFTPAELETVEDQNGEIVDTFFRRTALSMISVAGKTGVRDMVSHEADLVEKVFSKRLNMEYDWKRKPFGVGMSINRDHLVFSTQPWPTVDHFDTIREAWESYTKDGMVCLKTVGAYNTFAKHVEVQSFMSMDLAKYMKKIDGDIVRLRQSLCSAWRHSAAGLEWRGEGMSATEFANLLARHDIPCKKTDVENAKAKTFIPNACPATDAVIDRLRALRADFPALDVETFLYRDITGRAITMISHVNCPFVSRVR